MNRTPCSLIPGALHNCPSRYMSANSVANNSTPIPMYRWMQRQVTACPEVKPCLQNLQHVVSGRILECFQYQIERFPKISNDLLLKVQPGSCKSEHQARVVYAALQSDVATFTKAMNQGNQAECVTLAEKFITSLPDRLLTISKAPGIYYPNDNRFRLQRHVDTLKIWLDAIKVLSADDIAGTDAPAVTLLRHDNTANDLNIIQLMQFWQEVTTQLLNIYKQPQKDHTKAITTINNLIKEFCACDPAFSEDNFSELKASLNTWQEQRVARMFSNDPQAAAGDFGKALTGVYHAADVIRLGLYLGLSFTEIDSHIKRSQTKATTPILEQVLTQRFQEEGPQAFRTTQHDIISALTMCRELRLVKQLSQDWNISTPARPYDAVQEMRDLQPNAPVPLLLAIQLISHGTINYYAMGLALGLSIPDIENTVAHSIRPTAGLCTILNAAMPLTRQKLEKAMSHPALHGCMNSLLEQLGAPLAWQPERHQLDGGSEAILDAKHIHHLSPEVNWIAFGYRLGVPFQLLESIHNQHSVRGTSTCFYLMLNRLEKKGTLTIGQLASCTRENGFSGILKHLPKSCIPNSDATVPPITLPNRAHELTISLLDNYADKWAEVAQYFRVDLSKINTLSVYSDDTKMLAVLDRAFRDNTRTLELEYNQLLDYLAPHPLGGSSNCTI